MHFILLLEVKVNPQTKVKMLDKLTRPQRESCSRALVLMNCLEDTPVMLLLLIAGASQGLWMSSNLISSG